MLSIPKGDLVWLVRTMAKYYEMDPGKLERLVENLTGFNRDACGAYTRGMMAIPVKYVKQFKFTEAKDWRRQVGLAFKILDKLRFYFCGNLDKAIAAYVSSIEEVQKAASQASFYPDEWRSKLPEHPRTFMEKICA